MDCEQQHVAKLSLSSPDRVRFSVDASERSQDGSGIQGRPGSLQLLATACELKELRDLALSPNKKKPDRGTRLVIIDKSSKGSSQRSKELLDAEARSHAARVAHARKRNTQNRAVYSTLAHWRDAVFARQTIEVSRNIACPSDDLACFSRIQIPVSIQLYLDLLVPNLQGVYQVFHVKTIWNEEFLPHMALETYYYIAAATVQSIHDAYNNPHRIGKPSAQVLRHKADAIRILRQDLARGDACDTSLLSIMFLGLLEGRFWSAEQRDFHRKALGEIIRKKGGLGRVDDYIRRILVQFDFFMVMETGCHPIAGSIDQITFVEPFDHHLLVDEMPCGFQTLARADKLRSDVVCAIVRTKHLRQLWRQMRQVPKNHTLLDADSRTPPYSDFWQGCPSLFAQSETTEPQINNLVCLGIWLYALLEFSHRPTWETMTLWVSMSRWIRKELSTKLMQCVSVRDKDEEDCLQWLVGIAIESWKSADHCLLYEGRLLGDFEQGRFSASAAHRVLCEIFFDLTKISGVPGSGSRR